MNMLQDHSPENGLQGQRPDRKRHSSSRRSRKRPHAGSLHLDIRLSLLEADEGDEENSQGGQQGNLLQNNQHTIQDKAAGTLSMSCAGMVQQVSAVCHTHQAPQVDQQLLHKQQQQQLLQQLQPPPEVLALQQRNERQRVLQQQHQQEQSLAVADGDDDAEVLPETPGSQQLGSQQQGCGDHVIAASPEGTEGDDVVPATPTDEEGMDTPLSLQCMYTSALTAPGQANLAQQQQQQQPQHAHDFMFPESDKKPAATTPTLGLRSVSRLGSEAGDDQLGVRRFPALAAQQANQQQQQQQEGAPAGFCSAAQQQLNPAAAFETPSGATGRKQLGAAAAAAGAVSGLRNSTAAAGHYERTPSTGGSKGGRSPSDEAMCVLLDSVDRKQQQQQDRRQQHASSWLPQPAATGQIPPAVNPGSSCGFSAATAKAAAAGTLPVSPVMGVATGAQQANPLPQQAAASKQGSFLDRFLQHAHTWDNEGGQQQQQAPTVQEQQQKKTSLRERWGYVASAPAQQKPIPAQQPAPPGQKPALLLSPSKQAALSDAAAAAAICPTGLQHGALFGAAAGAAGSAGGAAAAPNAVATAAAAAAASRPGYLPKGVLGSSRNDLAPAGASGGTCDHVSGSSRGDGSGGVSSSSVGALSGILTAKQLLSPAAKVNAVAGVTAGLSNSVLKQHQQLLLQQQQQARGGQYKQQQQQPGVSPAAQSDRSVCSGSKPGSTGSLTPSTLAALEALEQQYAGHHTYPNPPSVGQQQQQREQELPSRQPQQHHQQRQVPVACIAPTDTANTADAEMEPTAVMGASGLQEQRGQAAAACPAEHAAAVRGQIVQLQPEADPEHPNSPLAKRQRLQHQNEAVPAQQQQQQQQQQADDAQPSIVHRGVRRFDESPLVGKVLFEGGAEAAAAQAEGSGCQLQLDAPQGWRAPMDWQMEGQQQQQQQQQLTMPPHAVLTAGDPADQPPTAAGQPAAVGQQSSTAAAPSDGTGLTQPATATTAAAVATATAAAAAAAEGSDDESSDDADDAWGCGVGVFSQAAAAAHIKRVGQQLDDAFRATPGARHRQQQPSQLQPPVQQQQQQPASQQQIPAALPTPPPAAAATATAAAATQPGSAAGTSPGSTQNTMGLSSQHMQLASYLPQELVEAYQGMGMVHDLYQWQAECLNQQGVLGGSNLVYCAPTSGGKSLVAEVLMLRRIVSTGKAALLVMPYVSLCAQKAAYLEKLLAPLGRTVKAMYGGLGGTSITPGETGVIVATIEKANALVSRMLEEECLEQLCCVVVDELHMVGDEDRGYLLELLLTKLRYATLAAKEAADSVQAKTQHAQAATSQQQQQGQEQQNTPSQQQQQQDQQAPGSPYTPESVGLCTPGDFGQQLQIVGMSATLPNVDHVARWLDALLYKTTFRPVHLKQWVKVDRTLQDADGQVVRELDVPANWEKEHRDDDHVAWLTQETVQAGHSVLIFCGTKAQCEVVAKHIANHITVPERAQPARPGADAAADRDAAAAGHISRTQLLEELARVSAKPDDALKEVLPKGVAYHHSGLSSDERVVVERAFCSGAISVLCATSTLAAGVNLPARRVIFKHAWVGFARNVLDATKYRQMAGRAGRAGIDTEGEAILIASKNNNGAPVKMKELMQADSEPIYSCLVEERRGMKRAMLEVVAAGVVATSDDVERYLKCSLLAATQDFQQVAATSTLEALKWLCQTGFIRWQVDEYGGSYIATELGKATAAAGLDPKQALDVKQDLEKARQGFCMATDLHLTFLVTPVQEELIVNWQLLLDWVQKAKGPDARVQEFVELPQSYINMQAQGLIRRATKLSEKQQKQDRICVRFYGALVLQDLIAEVPVQVVASNYKISKGQVQGLQDRAGRFAAMVGAFCARLGWTDLEALVTKFQQRVFFGVKPEVLALTEITGVKGARARLLYKAGLRTPEAVAATDIDRLTELLLSGTVHAAGGNPEAHARHAARMILSSAKELVAAKAREYTEQGQALLAALAPSQTPFKATASLAGRPKSPYPTQRFVGSAAAPDSSAHPHSSTAAAAAAGGAGGRAPEGSQQTRGGAGGGAGGRTGRGSTRGNSSSARKGSRVSGSSSQGQQLRQQWHQQEAQKLQQKQEPGGQAPAQAALHQQQMQAAAQQGRVSQQPQQQQERQQQQQQAMQQQMPPNQQQHQQQQQLQDKQPQQLKPAWKQQQHPTGQQQQQLPHPLQQHQQQLAQPLQQQQQPQQQQQQQSAALRPKWVQGSRPDAPGSHMMGQDGRSQTAVAADSANQTYNRQQQHPAQQQAQQQQQKQAQQQQVQQRQVQQQAQPHMQQQQQAQQQQQQQHAQQQRQAQQQALPHMQPRKRSAEPPDMSQQGMQQAAKRLAADPAAAAAGGSTWQDHSYSSGQQGGVAAGGAPRGSMGPPRPVGPLGPRSQQQQQHQQQQHHNHQHHQQQQYQQQQQQDQRQQQQQDQRQQPHGQHGQRQQQQGHQGSQGHARVLQHQQQQQQQQRQHQKQQQHGSGTAAAARLPPSGPRFRTSSGSSQRAQHSNTEVMQHAGSRDSSSVPDGSAAATAAGSTQAGGATCAGNIQHPQQHPQQQQQQQQQQQRTEPRRNQGVTMIKDSLGMQQLVQTLAAAPCWSFSLVFDTDLAGAAATARPGTGLALPKPPTPGKRGKRKAAPASDAAAAADFDWLDDEAELPSKDVQKAARSEQPQQPQQQWEWNVLGVAFSTGDGCAYVVALTNSSSSSSTGGSGESGRADEGGATVRVGTDTRLQHMWAGLQAIFSSSSSSTSSDGCEGTTGGQVMASNCNGAMQQRDGTAASYRSRLQDLATAARNAAAPVTNSKQQQQQQQQQVPALTSSAWWGLGPVKVTFWLKPQLALLSQPPPGSGLSGLTVAEPCVDVRVALWCLNPEAQEVQEANWAGATGCRSLTRSLEVLMDKWISLPDKMAATAGLPRPGQPGAGRFLGACRRACMSLKLHRKTIDLVRCEGVLPALSTIELPLVRVLMSMESQGVCLSQEALRQQRPALERRLQQLEAQAAAAVGGRRFNLSAPAEVGRILFQDLKLTPPPGAKLCKNGQYSTNKEVLEELVAQHPLPSIILAHRKLSKLLTGFLDTLLQLGQRKAQKQGPDVQVRIRGQFMQTNTATGRLAMEEPSLQTIPRPVEYELDASTQDALALTSPLVAPAAAAAGSGGASISAAAAAAGSGGAAASSGGGGISGGVLQESNIRAAFVAPPGWLLLGADYRQLELRLMAHFSGDSNLLAALGNQESDPFVKLAANWLNLPVEQVDTAARNQAKRLAYGVLYGMGPQALGKELNMDAQQAYQLSETFFKSFPGVKQWQESVISGCKEVTWVTTLAGRRRPLLHIHEAGRKSAQAERQAVNTVCQGSGADIVKGAMVYLQEQLASTGLSEHCHMLLQVHDELLFEVREGHVAAAASLVQRAMEDAAAVWALKVALPVKVSVGSSWGQLQEYVAQ